MVITREVTKSGTKTSVKQNRKTSAQVRTAA